MTTSEWISCAEHLPEGEEYVLCCTKTKRGTKTIIIGYYIPAAERWACGMNSNVIAWQPLPPVYEEEQL